MHHAVSKLQGLSLFAWLLSFKTCIFPKKTVLFVYKISHLLHFNQVIVILNINSEY